MMKIGDLVKRKMVYPNGQRAPNIFGKLEPEPYGIIIAERDTMFPSNEDPLLQASNKLYTITFVNGNTHVFPESYIELVNEV